MTVNVSRFLRLLLQIPERAKVRHRQLHTLIAGLFSNSAVSCGSGNGVQQLLIRPFLNVRRSQVRHLENFPAGDIAASVQGMA